MVCFGNQARVQDRQLQPIAVAPRDLTAAESRHTCLASRHSRQMESNENCNFYIAKAEIDTLTKCTGEPAKGKQAVTG